MNVLISAFACAPGLGSEHGQGWGVADQAAKRHNVWVLTDEHCRRAIEAYSPTLPTFIYIEPWKADASALRRTLAGAYYLAWQAKAFIEAKRLHAQLGFDLVHHVTYGSAWMPSFMGHLGIPFVIRSGAKERLPWWCYGDLSTGGKLRAFSRSTGLACIGPLVDACATSKADAILSSSDSTYWRNMASFTPFATGGLSAVEINVLGQIQPRRCLPFRIASIGGLTGWKGFALGIRGFAEFSRRFPRSEYWIAGHGQERQQLEALSGSLGCSQRVRFLGALSRQGVFSMLAEVDVLLHPALHEEFGFVVLEAMAAGKPVIAMDIAGPSHLLTSQAGVLIRPTSREQVISEMVAALTRYTDPDERLAAGRAARKIAVKQFSWDSVGERIQKAYERALNASPQMASEAQNAHLLDTRGIRSRFIGSRGIHRH